ncbi:response regulator [Glycomyces terrestris]|uniref:Response regulator n=1 Tax=Glycomyces terrestris TaxID=2493553 RepID=A0A426V174_9ACTN|nr:response regulator [Glycomyces terrestris]RRS00593.1 response regulator [Glycomyces terrestris]
MSEAIWIELIKVLPAFLWIGFGFIALAVAKRIFTQQAPRMTKVETPWVTVELAQQAIEAAAARAPEAPQPDLHPWVPPIPVQQQPAFPVQAPPPPISPGGGPHADPNPYTHPSSALGGPNPWLADETWDRRDADPADDAEPADEPVQTEPARLRPPNTPPADEPADNANGAKPNDEPAEPLTAPRQPGNQAPGYLAPPPTTYYAPPLPATQNGYRGTAPLPPFPPPYAHPDAQRGLRAATRLAMSTDLLNGGAILWVDDRHEWNEPLVRLFRTAGLTVEAVTSTTHALNALKHRHFDLVVTDMRRDAEPDGADAGVNLLDRMVEAGIPTPAVIYSGSAAAVASAHPRAVTVTDSPERLVDTVVDIVGTRRNRLDQQHGTWLDRLKGS